MYKFLLIFRYLRRRVTPMFAAMAVALCTAMVIIVISVMGGFFVAMTEAIHALEADVMISSGLNGFPHYEELLKKVRKLKQVESAACLIQTYGLVKIEPDIIWPVEIYGIDSKTFNRVIHYRSTLYWTPQRRSGAWPDLDLTEAGMSFQTPSAWGNRPGIVMGIGISPTNQRDEKGQYHFANHIVGETVILNIIDATRGTARPVTRPMTIVNEYKSGAFEIDTRRVFVDFDFLQKALKMNRWEGTNEDGNPIVEPARVTNIVIRSRPGVGLPALRAAVVEAGRGFIRLHPDMPVPSVSTWEQRHATIINAVKNEKGLITFLFIFIGLVAFFMVVATFYNIVLEKTRDIGVLRALGATRRGVAAVFLGYGLAIGMVGSLAGCGLAVAIVTNLNEIQDLIHAWTGWRMWDPRIYLFDRIPDQVNYREASLIMAGAIISSVIGSLIPAIVASRVNPIKALHYE